MIQGPQGYNSGFGNRPNDPTRSVDFLGASPFGNPLGANLASSTLNAASTTFNTVNTAGMLAATLSGFGVGGAGLAGFGRIAGGLGFSGMAMPLIAPMMIGHALGGIAHGATQQSATHNVMNQMAGQRNMGGYGGVGFDNRSAQLMSETMRSLAGIPDMLTNQGELMNVMKGLSNMKLMQSAKNAKEMSSKFTTLVTTMRDMAKDLGTTLEGVMPYIEQFNNQGFYNMKDIKRNAVMTHTTAGVGIGMNEGKLVGLQGVGSDMVGRFGGRRNIGSEGMRNMVGQVSVGMKRGFIDEETVHSVTGKRGEEGVAEMSQRMMGVNMNLMQSQGFGDMLTGVLGKQDDKGRFTGELDSDMMAKLQSGKLSMSDMHKIFNEKMGKSKESGVTLLTNQQRGMGAEFATKMGPRGMKNAIDAMLSDKAATDEEKKLLLKDIVNEDMMLIDAIFKLNESSDKMSKFLDDEMNNVGRRNRMMTALKERSVGTKFKKFSTSVGHAMYAPFEEMGSAYSTHMGEVGDLASHDFANGNWGKAAARMIGGVFGIQPTLIRGSTQDIQQNVMEDFLTSTGPSGTKGATSHDVIRKGLSSVLNDVTTNKSAIGIQHDKDAYFGNQIKNYDFIDSYDYAKVKSGETGRDKFSKYSGRADKNKMVNNVRNVLQEAGNKGLSGADKRRYVLNKIRGNHEFVGLDQMGGLDAIFSEIERTSGDKDEISDIRQVRESMFNSIESGSTSEFSELGLDEVAKKRQEMFDSSDSYTGMWDWSTGNNELSMDSTQLMAVFGKDSKVSLKDQREYAKLYKQILGNKDENYGFKRKFATARSQGTLDQFLESQGIKLTKDQIGDELLNEFGQMSTDFMSLSDKKKNVASKHASDVEALIERQYKLEKGSAHQSLMKYTFDDAMMNEDAFKYMKTFAETGDMKSLESAVGSMDEALLKKATNPMHKDMVQKVLAEKEAIRKGGSSYTRDKLGAETYDKMMEKVKSGDLTMEQVNLRAAALPVLEQANPAGNRTIDENIMMSGGYSAEVADALAQANITMNKYMESATTAITKNMAFAEKTTEAVTTLSNVITSHNKP